MVTVYREYTRNRIGLVFGLGGGQLIVLGLGALPVFIARRRGGGGITTTGRGGP